jgi:DNA-binding MarR family transcriptional regulator
MTDGTSETATTLPQEVRDMPPSAKLVAKTLAYEGELTQAELTDETLLPGRTVRHALTLLEEQGVVTSQISFMDARQQLYELERRHGE